MIVKIVTLFLIGIGVLAMFGRLRVGRLGDWRPGSGRPGSGRLGRARTCPKCGRHLIGQGPCPCGHSHNTRT
ncbi:MAG: hypothetical protein H5U20_01325 [Rhodobacteraceae bacterium]|nr:hypothetical protein [Paracoccaceae bacterium]